MAAPLPVRDFEEQSRRGAYSAQFIAFLTAALTASWLISAKEPSCHLLQDLPIDLYFGDYPEDDICSGSIKIYSSVGQNNMIHALNLDVGFPAREDFL